MVGGLDSVVRRKTKQCKVADVTLYMLTMQ